MLKTTQQNNSIERLGIQYSEKDNRCKREVKNRQMEFDILIPTKTKTTL